MSLSSGSSRWGRGVRCGLAILVLSLVGATGARAEGVAGLVTFGASSPLLSLTAARAEGTRVQPLNLVTAADPLPLTKSVLPLLSLGVTQPVEVVLLPRPTAGRMVGMKSRNSRDLPQAVSASLIR